MAKSRPRVTSKLKEWQEWLIRHVPKPIRNKASRAFKTFKDKVRGLYDRIKGEKEPKEEKQNGEEDSFNPYEVERAFRGAYRSFRINGRSRMDVDTFFERIRENLVGLKTKELKDLDSAKLQTTARIRFEVEVDDGDLNVIRVYMVDKAFNSRMMEVFKGSDLNEILEEMFTHIQTQIKNLALANSRSVFCVSRCQLNLTRGSSYLPLPD